jgi:hypothetical protein
MGQAEKARRLRQLRRLRESIALSGFPTSSTIEHIAALSATLSAILGARDDDERASRAALYSYEIAERTLARSAGAVLACRKGCAHCCKQLVTASPPQVFAIANHLRRAAGGVAAVLEPVRRADSVTRGLDRMARLGKGMPCALLVNEACTVYTLRPMACRGFVSESLDACIRSFSTGPFRIPAPPHYQAVRTACELALWAALHERGLGIDSYELNEALRLALEQPDAEARWLAGEDVFASVSKDTTADQIPLETKKAHLENILAIAKGDR